MALTDGERCLAVDRAQPGVERAADRNLRASPRKMRRFAAIGGVSGMSSMSRRPSESRHGEAQERMAGLRREQAETRISPLGARAAAEVGTLGLTPQLEPVPAKSTRRSPRRPGKLPIVVGLTGSRHCPGRPRCKSCGSGRSSQSEPPRRTNRVLLQVASAARGGSRLGWLLWGDSRHWW